MESELHKEKCTSGVQKLTEIEREELIKQLEKHWTIEKNELKRICEFKDFITAMHYVNSVAKVAEVCNHHPEIRIMYNKVHFNLTTHDSGGLTRNDFIVAAKIDNVIP